METVNKTTPGVSYFICGFNLDAEVVHSKLHDSNFNVELSNVSDIECFCIEYALYVAECLKCQVRTFKT